ncbi:MAG: type II secretion system F family protein [Planctomycetaceae bacterium]|nr:type II secretion system F family protein [Planctomycetaceae bacterium]MCP4477303.1 type II secretion system F family protein [Planctomycetaceae bacterium]
MNILFLISAIDFVAILPFAAFAAIAIGFWVVSDIFLNGKTKTESRLEQMKNRSLGKPEIVKSSGGAKEGITKLLEQASPKIAEALQPKNEKEAGKLKQKLDEAGWRTENATQILSTLKVVSAGFGFFLGGGVALFTNGFNTYSLIYALVALVGFMLIPELILRFIGAQRKQKLFLGLPDALDLMVVCVEAGLGMDQALRKVADEMFFTHPTVANEFKLCNHQLQMGSTREIVLMELGRRNGVDDLKTLASVMIQVDKFGTSVGKALRIQSDAMRTRRRQIAEEKAAKTAVKLIFPLVLFIFPGIFVILVGPAALTMINEMLPIMSGQ